MECLKYRLIRGFPRRVIADIRPINVTKILGKCLALSKFNFSCTKCILVLVCIRVTERQLCSAIVSIAVVSQDFQLERPPGLLQI